MRGAIPVNLASEPFRRDRPVIVLGWAIGALLGGLLLFLLTMVWIQRGEAAGSREALAKVRAQLATMGAERAKLEGEMRQGVNAQAVEHSVFYNALLHRKGISWTRIFADLEKVMPHTVRLITIRPQVNGENQVVLDMVVGSQATEPVIDMLMRLEGSPRFGATAVSSWLPPTQTEPLYRYRVSANYDPTI